MGKGNKPTRPVPSGPPGAVAPCPTCLIVRITDIAGLYKPGADDRPLADQGGGTTQGSGYAPPYTSSDNQGRIFIDSVPAKFPHAPLLDSATWTDKKQFVDITVQVDPPTIAIPPGSKITWLFFDPDDPTNEGPDVHPEAGVILDPNDYSGSPPAKTGRQRPHRQRSATPQGEAGVAEVRESAGRRGSTRLRRQRDAGRHPHAQPARSAST